MTEKEIQELEEILIPFALDRLGMFFVGKKFKKFYEWIVRAFIRCLFNITEESHLLEITTISIAEAYFMDEIKIFSAVDKSIKQFLEESSQMMYGEIHQWLIYLQEQGRLPGTYNRFSGKFKLK